MEKTKRDFHSTKYYVNALDKETVRTDHPLQRSSDQWSEEYRDGLIGTVLKNEDIPYIVICEQILEDVIKNYLIDGIQRITTIYNYRRNVFKLGNKVENPLVEYETIKTDENGNNLRDENGELIRETVVCDIRGKYYRDLPKELQETFDEYQIMEVKHLNCSDARIGYEIRRYNHAKNMGASQSGITYLNSSIAEEIKSITSHTFFKDLGNFTKTEKKNDTFSRVVLETIMTTYFLDKWKSPLKDICSFMNENLESDMLLTLKNTLNDISNVITSNTKQMFTSKNSFLWLATYHKFMKLGLEPKRFIEFMEEFDTILTDKEWNGETFTELNKVSTKKKNLIIKKLQLLEEFMLEFLHISQDDAKEIDYKEFVKANVEDVIDGDIEMFQISANDASEELDEASWMLSEQNYPAYLAIVGLAFRLDEEDTLKEWLPIYERNNQFIRNQQEAFLHMKQSFEMYLKKGIMA